jgi:3-methyl-2-oxobutanoate hydroxymethyltransferase
MRHNRLTVADLRALKGKRQLTMLFVETTDEAGAASAAGIDILSIVEPLWTRQMREAAGDCFVQVGLIYGQHCTYEDYLRAAHAGLIIGGDAFYCAGSLDTIAKLSAEGIPVIGHVGLVPARATWTGGFRAVGKTAASALQVFNHVKQLEAAGAVGAEIEVVPARVAAEISRRTSLVLLSMGAGRSGRAISVRRRRPRLYSRSSTAPCKGLSQFPCGVRAAAKGAHRRVQGIPRRRRDRGLSRAQPSRTDRGPGV